MQWVASTLHTTSEHGASTITTADAHTSAASSRLNWRVPADLNGPVCFAERRNLVSARVPSHFNRSLLNCLSVGETTGICLVANVVRHFSVWLSFALLVVPAAISRFSRIPFEKVMSHYAVSSPTFPVNIIFPAFSVAPFRPLQWILIGISRSPHGICQSALRYKRGHTWLIFGRCPIRISLGTLILGDD